MSGSDVEYLRARFEACGVFRGGHDDVVCSCGWLEADHDTPAVAVAIPLAVVTAVRGRRPRIRVPERRAS